MTNTETAVAAGKANGKADAAAAAAVIQRIVQAWAGQDADAFAGVFSPDGTMVLPGDIYRSGRDDIRAFMAAAFQGPYRDTRVTGQPLGLRLITPDVAVVVTQGGVLQPGETAVAPEREIRATWVVVRHDNGWYLAAYQNSPIR